MGKQWSGFIAHVKQPAAAIGRMLAPFDQSTLSHLVEDADQRDWLYLKHFSKACLVDALIVGEIGKGLPLRPRQPKPLRALLEPLAKQPGKRKPRVGFAFILLEACYS